MPLWAVLACTVLGTLGNILTYVAMVKANRTMEEKREKGQIAKDAERDLKIAQMYKAFLKDHGLNGGN